MALFVVQHKHDPENCPAGHPQMGPALLKHVMPAFAQAKGITIEGEAVVNNAHTFYLILRADSRDKVNEYMEPFARVGTVEISEASTCEQVIGRKRC